MYVCIHACAYVCVRVCVCLQVVYVYAVPVYLVPLLFYLEVGFEAIGGAGGHN